MKLDENYRINCEDEKNVTLEKKKIVTSEKSKNLGKIYWDAIGYYPNVKGALKRYCDIQLNNSLKDVLNIMSKYDELMNKIESL